MVCCFSTSPPSHVEVAVLDEIGCDFMGELRETCESRGWNCPTFPLRWGGGTQW